jgi:acyl-CoA reductase-like NAD-dependent aldehyde dehydrogenase
MYRASFHQGAFGAADGLAQRVARARKAQENWANRPVAERIAIVRRVRAWLASNGERLAELSASLRGRPAAEALTSELLPLLEAHRFAENASAALLTPQRLSGRGRPAWLTGVLSEIHREARGVVLIVAPRNYPLMLPGIQALQALVAGNAVVLKPAPGTTPVGLALAEGWLNSGLDPDLLIVAPEETERVAELLDGGVGLVVLTGSAAAGESIALKCAERMIPTIMELSGCDAVIVRADADVELTAAALAFGLRLNGGETCIAPHRVFVARAVAERLEAALVQRIEALSSSTAAVTFAKPGEEFLQRARAAGATVLHGGVTSGGLAVPIVVAGDARLAGLFDQETFGPVLAIIFVDSDEEAIALSRRSSMALGASVFSRDVDAARRVAARIDAGVVSINDLILPTADPRLPFGGRRRSGWGVTRGAEGILAMTNAKAVTISTGSKRRHFDPLQPGDSALFAAYARFVHGGGFRQRFRALRELFSNLRRRARPGISDKP